MGRFFQYAVRFFQPGAIVATVLSVGACAAYAQQTDMPASPSNSNSSDLIATDGTLIPDFLRREQQIMENPEGDAGSVQQATPNQFGGVQDPLNNLYRNRQSTVIDQRDRERINASSTDPLRQLPRSFESPDRESKLQQDLQIMEGVGRDDYPGRTDWRERDDYAFEALGVRAGSFVFYPELYSRMITTNNLFAEEGRGRADQALQLTPQFRARSDWNNHELEFFATGTKTRWRKFNAESTWEYETFLRGRIDVTRRTKLAGGLRIEQEAEDRDSIDLPQSAKHPANTQEIELFGQINHRFNRLGFRLRGQVIRNLHEDVALNDGTTQLNGERDYDEQSLVLRTNYEFSPRFSLFSDTGLTRRTFRHRQTNGGFVQGSKGWLAAIGAGIEFSDSVRFLGRVGYARAHPDEQRLVNLEGVVYDAQLIWRPTRLMTVNLKGGTTLEETSASNSPGSINRTLSLELINSWTHRLTSKATFDYEGKDYAGINQFDREMTVGLGFEYLFNRSLLFDTGFSHKRVDGSSEYKENQFHVGLKVRR